MIKNKWYIYIYSVISSHLWILGALLFRYWKAKNHLAVEVENIVGTKALLNPRYNKLRKGKGRLENIKEVTNQNKPIKHPSPWLLSKLQPKNKNIIYN